MTLPITAGIAWGFSGRPWRSVFVQRRLFQTYGHSELAIYGLTSKTAHQILTIAVDAIRSGHPLDPTRPSNALLEGAACCFVEVPKSKYRDQFGFARWYYRGDSFPALQVVYPSRDGHFPWDPQASDSFRTLQPVLGHRPTSQ